MEAWQTVGSETFERFRRSVEQEWRNPAVTAAYRKWSRQESEWGRTLADLLIARADLAAGHQVLDIGSAHGEPGIQIAETVGPDGHVTLLDLAPDLLALAAQRAREGGLTNVTTRVADAHNLPFPDSSFDRVTARLAAMYFADPSRAFRDALRVLRPGGRATYLVWGSFEQPMFRDVIGVLFKYVSPPDDEPGSPSPFRYSEPGSLAGALNEAGFADTREENATVQTTFPGGPERWWEWLVDTAAPVQTWMAAMEERELKMALDEIHRALRGFHNGQSVDIPVDVIVGSGRKRA
jgi:ubiquinone/menaquinone biosynthesis C-methylase UbiE